MTLRTLPAWAYRYPDPGDTRIPELEAKVRELAALLEAFRVTVTEEREWVRMVNRWTRDKKNFDRDAVASATEQMDTYLTGVLDELTNGGDGSVAAGRPGRGGEK